MSKIGRRPVQVKGASVVINGQLVQYSGAKGKGHHSVAEFFTPVIENGFLYLRLKDEANKGMRNVNCAWGLERALLANKIQGSVALFEKKLKILGLGFKATPASPQIIVDLEKKGERVLLVGDQPSSSSNKGLLFELGYSHYYYFGLPSEIEIEVDKLGQTITIRSTDVALAGTYAAKIKALRRTEPYKGTGIRGETEVVRRKTGKKTG